MQAEEQIKISSRQKKLNHSHNTETGKQLFIELGSKTTGSKSYFKTSVCNRNLTIDYLNWK